MPNIEESKILYQLTVKELKDVIASAIEDRFNEIDCKIDNLTALLTSLSKGLDADCFDNEMTPVKSPISFTLCGHYYEDKHWKELVVTLYEEIYQGNKHHFRKVLQEIPAWFSNDPNELAPTSSPKQIGESGIWGKTHIGEVHFRDVVEKLRKCFGYDETNLSVGID